MQRLQQSLIAAQELGDEKMKLTQGLQELIDHKVRQLEHDYKNLDYGQDELMQTEAGVVTPKDAYQFSSGASPVPNSPSGLASGGNLFSGNSQVFMSLVANGNSGMLGGGNGGDRMSSSNSSHNGSSAGGANGGSSHYGGAGNAGSGSGKRARRVRNDAGDLGSSDSNVENSGKASSSYIQQSGSHSSLNMSGSGGGGGGQQGSGRGKAGQQATNSAKKKKRKARVQGGASGAAAAGALAVSGGSGGAGTSAMGMHSSGRDMRDDTPPQEDTIDPDEPTYCLCDQISFGEMILCDNDLCPIEWFHFSCVSLVSKPKGKWYCPNCRGDRPNIMKNKAQFLKELERYNKEREEKT